MPSVMLNIHTASQLWQTLSMAITPLHTWRSWGMETQELVHMVLLDWPEAQPWTQAACLGHFLTLNHKKETFFFLKKLVHRLSSITLCFGSWQHRPSWQEQWPRRPAYCLTVRKQKTQKMPSFQYAFKATPIMAFHQTPPPKCLLPSSATGWGPSL